MSTPGRSSGVALIDGKVCSLEALWKGEDNQDNVNQDELLLALLKGRRDSHIVFW